VDIAQLPECGLSFFLLQRHKLFFFFFSCQKANYVIKKKEKEKREEEEEEETLGLLSFNLLVQSNHVWFYINKPFEVYQWVSKEIKNEVWPLRSWSC
jgi:hypothetical protein